MYQNTTLARQTTGDTITGADLDTTHGVLILNADNGGTRGMMGDGDEYRLRNGTLSANWITTEYNNQSDESGFWGTWTTVSGGAPTFIPRIMVY